METEKPKTEPPPADCNGEIEEIRGWYRRAKAAWRFFWGASKKAAILLTITSLGLGILIRLIQFAMEIWDRWHR
jgi:hypothetical protein